MDFYFLTRGYPGDLGTINKIEYLNVTQTGKERRGEYERI